MAIVLFILGTFALAFAGLTRQSDELSPRPDAAASNCGDAVGVPCPSRRAM
jgi:hypothetical protein